MKVRVRDQDGVLMTRSINPKNFDPERMEIVSHDPISRRFLNEGF